MSIAALNAFQRDISIPGMGNGGVTGTGDWWYMRGLQFFSRSRLFEEQIENLKKKAIPDLYTAP